MCRGSRVPPLHRRRHWRHLRHLPRRTHSDIPVTPDAGQCVPATPFRSRTVTAPAYEDLLARQLDAGVAEGPARCGVTTLANQAVGASFVGTATASLVLAQALREMIIGQPAAEVISFNLRAPEHTEVAPNATASATNPGYTNNLLS
jgi:hypothetical protein